MEKEDELFSVYVEKQDANGNVQWFATVPNDHTFAANHKRRLESNEIFKLFVTASSRVADNRKILCRLVQKDPQVIAEVCSSCLGLVLIELTIFILFSREKVLTVNSG
jgi:hypothetical protein